tara:strand:+ start:206 stop:736 length:531 start_codon:yes stop_codon:yes gene_type:complete
MNKKNMQIEKEIVSLQTLLNDSVTPYEKKVLHHTELGRLYMELYKDDQVTLIEVLGEHGRKKPVDKPLEYRLSARLIVRFPKLVKTKDGKLSGGNVYIQNKGFQAMYQPVTGFAQYLDDLHASGLKDSHYNALKEMVISHLPYSKRHVDASKKPSEMIDIKENNPFTISDLPVAWS